MEKTTLRNTRLALALAGILATATGHAATTIDYTYDDLNRLTAQVRADGPQISYSYDEVGNITAIANANPDSDGDGLADVDEVNVHATDTNLTDTDSDGLGDGQEVLTYHTNPLAADTDGDGANDGDEVAAGTDPLNPASFPVVADGDLNLDGVVDTADVVLAMRFINGNLIPTAEQLRHGDMAPLVNGVSTPNGTFDLGDVVVIRKKAMGEAQ